MSLKRFEGVEEGILIMTVLLFRTSVPACHQLLFSRLLTHYNVHHLRLLRQCLMFCSALFMFILDFDSELACLGRFFLCFSHQKRLDPSNFRFRVHFFRSENTCCHDGGLPHTGLPRALPLFNKSTGLLAFLQGFAILFAFSYCSL